MGAKTARPDSRVARTGLGLEKSFPAISILSVTTPAILQQQNFAVLRLARRFGLAPSTAAVVADLAGIGGCQ